LNTRIYMYLCSECDFRLILVLLDIRDRYYHHKCQYDLDHVTCTSDLSLYTTINNNTCSTFFLLKTFISVLLFMGSKDPRANSPRANLDTCLRIVSKGSKVSTRFSGPGLHYFILSRHPRNHTQSLCIIQSS